MSDVSCRQGAALRRRPDDVEPVDAAGVFAAPASPGVRGAATSPASDLQRSMDLDSFWDASLRMMREALPHHSCSLMLGISDFEPRAAKHHVAEAQRLGYTPATSLAVSRPFLAANPQVRLYTYSQILSQDAQAHQRRLAQEEPLEEWVEFAHLAFWNGDRPVAVMSIRRSERQARFSEDELGFLEQAHPMMDAGIFRLRALEHERAEGAALRRLLCGSASPTMLLDAQGAILFATDEAYRLCQMWNESLEEPPPGVQETLPLIPQSLPRLLQADGPVEAPRRIDHPTLPQLAIVIEPSLPDGGVFSQQVHGVLTFVTGAGSVRQDGMAERVRSLQQLSPSERKVALMVAEGLRNNQIAERLFRSRRTIECQLNSIYAKFGVESRTQLVKKLHST